MATPESAHTSKPIPTCDLPDDDPGALFEDLVNGVCPHPSGLSGAAKLLLYISATGRAVRRDDPGFHGIATRFGLTSPTLLRFTRKNYADLDEILRAVSALAHELGIDRLGAVEIKSSSASLLENAIRILEVEISEPATLLAQIPSSLQSRRARLKLIAKARAHRHEASIPATRPRIDGNHMVSEEGLIPPPRPIWCSALSDRVLIGLFAVFLLAPPIAYLMGWQGTTVLNEKRELAAAPDFRHDPISTWPAKTEAFYDDHFGFRAFLVRSYNLVLHKYLKGSNNDVVVGKDGWLFYARENIFKDFFGDAGLSDDELQRWKQFLREPPVGAGTK